MKILDHPQGSKEWFQARLGLPTASTLNKIVKPSNLLVTSGATTFMYKLIAEKLTGKSQDINFQSGWTERGQVLEDEALDAYRWRCPLYDVRQVGLCLEDGGRYGASPDALCRFDNNKGTLGGLEIKCPAGSTHVKYLLSGRLPNEYKLQVLGGMLVTGAEWWDFWSWHPDMDPLIVHTRRADVAADLKKLKRALERFCDRMDKKINQIRENQ